MGFGGGRLLQSWYPRLSVRSSFVAAVRGFVALSSSLLFCEICWAEACDRTRDHVSIAFIGDWTREVESAALTDLVAALEPRQIGVCSGETVDAGERTVSRVRVELADPTRVRIEVDDALTNKVVSRQIKVEDSTESASALIVAVAIDELLRATWAELTIQEEKSSPEREVTPRRQVHADPIVAPKPVVFRLPSHRISLQGALDAFVVGSVFFGGNFVYGSSIGNVFEWDAFAGPRVVRAKNASDLGQVRADALSMGLALRAPLIKGSAFVFGPEIGLSATHAWFRGRAEETDEMTSSGGEFQGWAVTARGGVDARFVLGSAFVSGATRIGIPLVALEVTDGQKIVGGMSGLEWSNGLSLGWWWQ